MRIGAITHLVQAFFGIVRTNMPLITRRCLYRQTMNFDRKISLLDGQIAEANHGSPDDFDAWQNRTEVVLRLIFGVGSPSYEKFQDLHYSPMIWTEGTDFRPYRMNGVREAMTILESAKLELEIEQEVPPTIAVENAPLVVEGSERVFIVHGQNDAMKYELESYLQKLLKVAPVILHQEPNAGQVLIEKLEASAASIGYSVVLLTGDDLGRAKQLANRDDKPRARQNVVFEMGFFLGLLGRQRLAVLYEPGVELPSDLSGLVYIPLDNAGGWKGKLASEMDHSGLTVDWSAIGRS